MYKRLYALYQHQSILNKLKFMGTFTALISMFISISIIIIYLNVNEKNSLKEKTKTFASILAESIAPAIIFNDMESVQLALSSIKYQKDIQEVYVMDKELIILQSYTQSSIPNAHFKLIDQIPSKKEIWSTNTLYLTVPIIEHHKTIGFIMVLSSLETYYQKLISQLLIILLSMIFAIWITLQFTAILREAILSPIEELNSHIDTIIKTQNLNTKIEILNTDEIGSLGQNFNTMISELKQMKNELTKQRNLAQHEASHDPLTSLFNRKSFKEALIQSTQEAKNSHTPLAIFFIDLDHFKEINDSLGHDIGDIVLKIFSERITSCIRKTDIFARMGGDEFMLIVKDIQDDMLPSKIAFKILQTMQHPIKIAQKEIYVSASIGISTYPKDGEDEETLIKHADIAMYQAKNNGKNQYQFYS